MFPNVFQTRIAPFDLEDTAKPGHMRLLMLHLIDPNRRAMSTGMVPCQRRDWWAHDIRTSYPRFWRLPREVFDLIIDNVEDWPISMEEGEKTRKEFLEERKEFRVRHTSAMEGYQQWDFDEDHGDDDDDEEEVVEEEDQGDDDDDDEEMEEEEDQGWDLCKLSESM